MTTFQEALSRPKIAQALGFAIARHASQKYGKDPYQVHLLKVAETVFELTDLSHGFIGVNFDDVMAGALLHDVLEDTETREDEILGLFGPQTLAIVKACTKTDDELCRRCAFRKTVVLLKGNTWALPVKLADRLSNMRMSVASQSPQLRMYLREYAEFKALLRPVGGWDTLWAELDRTFEEGVRINTGGRT